MIWRQSMRIEVFINFESITKTELRRDVAFQIGN